MGGGGKALQSASALSVTCFSTAELYSINHTPYELQPQRLMSRTARIARFMTVWTPKIARSSDNAGNIQLLLQNF